MFVINFHKNLEIKKLILFKFTMNFVKISNKKFISITYHFNSYIQWIRSYIHFYLN